MSIRLNQREAEQILLDEANRASREDPDEGWRERVERLSDACDAHRVFTHIAFLGTALLAKATNPRIDPFSVKASSRRPGAFSARGVGHGVLVRHAAALGIHLGTTGREPLNNQPYFRSEEVSAEMPIKESTRGALDVQMEVLSDLSRVATAEGAREALRAFIWVRRRRRPVYPALPTGSLPIGIAEFADRIGAFVGERSDGGRRAQAAVAGLLAAAFGAECVVSERVNDPDRNFPGDVGVRDPSGAATWQLVAEVRDKPVTASDVRVFAQKILEVGVRKAVVLAMSREQGDIDHEPQVSFASEHGSLLAYIVGWRDLVFGLGVFTSRPVTELVDLAHTEIASQLVAIGASPETVERWSRIAVAT